MLSKRKRESYDKDSWRTPKTLFDAYNVTFRFFADVFASDENHLCDRYLTKEDNALHINWGLYRKWRKRVVVKCPPDVGMILFDKSMYKVDDELSRILVRSVPMNFVWANIPYSNVEKCLRKIIAEMMRGLGVVCLLPYRGQVYWDELVVKKAARIEMIMGRLSFGHPETGKPENNCNFSSAIVIYDPRVYLTSQQDPDRYQAETYWISQQELGLKKL